MVMTDYDTSGTRDSSTESFIPIPFMQLVQEWKQFKAENARLREDIRAVSASWNDLRAQYGTLEAEIARLQEEAKARVASWNDLRAHADRLTRELAEARVCLEEMLNAPAHDSHVQIHISKRLREAKQAAREFLAKSEQA